MISAKRLFVFAAFLSAAHLGFLFFANQSGWLGEQIPAHWSFNLTPDRFVDFGQLIFEVSLLQAFGLVFPLPAMFVRPRLLAGLLKVAGFGIFLMMQVIAWFVTAVQLSAGEQRFPVLLFLGLLAFPILALVLSLTKPEVSLSDRLRIKVRGITLFSLDFSEVTSLSEIELRARDFGGLGIRYASKKLAFIPRAGRGVELKLNSGESVAIYSTQPEVLLQAIKTKLEQS